MNIQPRILIALFVSLTSAHETFAQPPDLTPPNAEVQQETVSEVEGDNANEITNENLCMKCHGNTELMVGEWKRLLVTASDLANDIHWQKGLLCSDCHGGDPTQVDFVKAHSKESGFRPAKPAINVPDFCGHCHSDPDYMRKYSPSLRTDQATVYWTSGHGHKLKQGDQQVATCVNCHGGRHNLRSIADSTSPVYAPNVAETCGHCHSDPKVMDGREHHGKPIGHNQVELWKKSIHAKLLLEQGDLSAPTCNDCHGNHGAARRNWFGGQRLWYVSRQDWRIVRQHTHEAQIRRSRPAGLRDVPQQP